MDGALACNKVVIGAGGFGRRVVCGAPIDAGERLFSITGRLIGTADRYSIQVGPCTHLSPDGASWALVNHGCRPNVVIDFNRWELVARRAIEPGEELTWDYLTTEWDMSSPFECGCEAAGCRRLIHGARYLAPPDRARLAPLCSPYIRERLERTVLDEASGITARTA